MRHNRTVRLLALLGAFAMVVAACGGDSDDDENFTIGVSNTLVGNGWREQMICAIKAESLARGTSNLPFSRRFIQIA